MRLDDQAGQADRPRQDGEVAAGQRPHQDEVAQHRHQQAVRLPRVDEQLAPQRPHQGGGRSHGDDHAPGARLPAGGDGDAHDGGDVDQGRPDRQPGVATELHGQRQRIEQQRAGVVHVEPEGQGG